MKPVITDHDGENCQKGSSYVVKVESRRNSFRINDVSSEFELSGKELHSKKGIDVKHDYDQDEVVSDWFESKGNWVENDPQIAYSKNSKESKSSECGYSHSFKLVNEWNQYDVNDGYECYDHVKYVKFVSEIVL